MPKIYVFVNGRFANGDVISQAIAEDGTPLGSHLSSNESFAKHDMGITSTWKHEHYAAHYPDGFDVVWVDDEEKCEGLDHALWLSREQEGEKTRKPLKGAASP